MKLLRILNQGIVEKIPRLSEHKDPGTVHYPPHQAVIKKDREATKLRIVFDAASKTKNDLSLNDSLLTGPCLLPLLNDILIRFRIGKYGLVADIKQAFLQICLNEEHRDFVLFLWFTDIHVINPEAVILRFAPVVFGLTASPFLLNATIKHHLEKYLHLTEFTEIIQKLILNLYVDDSTNTFNRVEDAIQFYKKSKIALTDASFNLRKWATNSKKIQNFIDNQFEEDKISEGTHRNVFGIIWDIQT